MNEHTRHDDNTPRLSPEGVARRGAMLDALCAETVRIGRARRVRRRATVGVAIAALLGMGVWAATLIPTTRAPITPHGAGEIAAAPEAPGDTDSAPSSVRVDVVRSGMAADRVAALTSRVVVPVERVSIDDRELLDILEEAGRPTGLVRTADGRVWLTSDVTGSFQ
ncbi:MAG: hypothetical protein EA379_09735 [Phycisphaerales bacterium]|nr:MAG: hypothetical protein EA379_09735 [Phycisphaerales bacterium]